MVRLQGKRLVRALVLGLLVLLFVGGGTGFAVAAGDEGEPPAMAFPRPGASATYSAEEFHVGDQDVDGYLPISSYTLTWMAETWVVDADYNVRLVHPLFSEIHFPISGGVTQYREAYYDAATGEPVITSGQGDYRANVEGLDCRGADDCTFRYDSYDGRGGACGMRNALQDGQDLRAPLKVTGYCDYVDGADEMTYRYVRESRVGATPAYLFQDEQQPHFKAWFSPDHAFPVRFTSTLSDEIYYGFLGHERMYDLRLQSETPGTSAYTRPLTSVVQPGLGSPSLAAAGRGAHLFDLEGFPSPFTFPQAYDAAVADSSEAGIAGFLADHPDAYVGEAYSQEARDENGGTHYGWFFTLTDGHDWKAVAVMHGPPGLGDQVVDAYLPTALAGEVGNVTVVSQWTMTDDMAAARSTGRFFPEATLLPTDLPRPADLLQRFGFIEARDVPGARYLGWRFQCGTDACLTVDSWIGAGYQLQTRQAPGVGESPLMELNVYSGDLAILVVEADGSPSLRHAFSYERPDYRPLLGNKADPAASDFKLAPQSIRREVTGVWQVPAPATVAGLSFLALLASALYYFWPALKGAAGQAGMGLFSRIEQGNVLDNPSRRLVHEAITAEPGIHFQALARKTGLGRGNLDHHLRKLVAADLVTMRRAPGYTCFFAKGAVGRQLADAAPALRSGGSRAVFDAVAQRPGASSRDLAAALGMAPSTVSYHLARLHKAGLVAPAPGSGVNLTPLGVQAASGIAAPQASRPADGAGVAAA